MHPDLAARSRITSKPINSKLNMAKENDLPALCSLHDFLKQDFDFVIVGGGTAGLAVAARLSENPNIHVGVLEAGKAHVGDPLISIPALHGKTSKNPKYDWMHNTVPQVCHLKGLLRT